MENFDGSEVPQRMPSTLRNEIDTLEKLRLEVGGKRQSSTALSSSFSRFTRLLYEDFCHLNLTWPSLFRMLFTSCQAARDQSILRAKSEFGRCQTSARIMGRIKMFVIQRNENCWMPKLGIASGPAQKCTVQRANFCEYIGFL